MKNKKHPFNSCGCNYCTKWRWPLLWHIPKINTYWFETPKNGTVSVKWGQKVRKHITSSPSPNVYPVVIWRDPVDRFKSLIKHYFMEKGGRHKFGIKFLKRNGLEPKNMSTSDIVDFVLDNLNKLTTEDEVHHFYPQVAFVDEDNYFKFELVNMKDISKRFAVKALNVSKKIDLEFTDEQISRIKEIYSLDYEFYENHKEDIVKIKENRPKANRGKNPIGIPPRYMKGFKKTEFNNIFEEIYKKGFWKHADGSGSDSRPEIVPDLFPILDDIFKNYDITTVSDLGCGSHYIFKDYKWPDHIKYTGYDASDTAIKRAEANTNRKDFNFVVESDWENIEPTDALITKDVLCHWPLPLVEEFFNEVTKRFKYVIVIGVEKITMCPALSNYDKEWAFYSGKGTAYGVWLYEKK